MRIFISAGEPSGDLHAANLARELQAQAPGVELFGFGGPQLRSTGTRLIYPLTELAVMWFGAVLRNIRTFVDLAHQAEREFQAQRPDAVVLIDYPGFHFALAKRAHRLGIPVIWFVPPQLWAWAGWRVAKMRKWVDALLCSLPFEPEWYQKRGHSNAEYIGHPYFDELDDRPLDHALIAELRNRPGPLVAILPGSRTQEIRKNLKIQLQAAVRVAERFPQARFAVACLHDRHAALVREIMQRHSIDPPALEIHSGRTPEIIRAARMAWAVSGSVGLELMHETLPTVILYKVGRFDLWVARWFIRSRYIGLVNLLADAEVMPEYLTPVDVTDDLVRWADRWLGEPAAHDAAVQQLAAVKARYAMPGATARAAARILSHIQRGTDSAASGVPAPHLTPIRSGSPTPP
jgi:lipid-A-disaccharide synthase